MKIKVKFLCKLNVAFVHFSFAKEIQGVGSAFIMFPLTYSCQAHIGHQLVHNGMVGTILDTGFPLRVQAMVNVGCLCSLGSEEYKLAVAGCLHKLDHLPSILGPLIKLS